MNPYTELDISVTASTEEIKQRYRTLAQMHHPDKGGDEELFKRIKLAYEILSDPIRRQQYDTTGKMHAIPSIRTEAVEQLSQMIFRMLPSLNADFDDLVLKMKVDVRQMKHDINVNNKNCKFIIANLNRVRERIKLKNEGENLLQGIVNRQIEGRQNELAEYARKIMVIELMAEILEEYYYGLHSWTTLIEGTSTTSTA